MRNKPPSVSILLPQVQFILYTNQFIHKTIKICRKITVILERYVGDNPKMCFEELVVYIFNNYNKSKKLHNFITLTLKYAKK